MGKSKKILGSTSGVKAQNAEWFASDIVIDDNVKTIISIAEDTGVTVEITKDSGTTWASLFSGAALTANAEHTFDVHVRTGDLFNMRTPTVGGTTVHWCRIDSIQTEA